MGVTKLIRSVLWSLDQKNFLEAAVDRGAAIGAVPERSNLQKMDSIFQLCRVNCLHEFSISARPVDTARSDQRAAFVAEPFESVRDTSRLAEIHLTITCEIPTVVD